jgi:hypothetical protein
MLWTGTRIKISARSTFYCFVLVFVLTAYTPLASLRIVLKICIRVRDCVLKDEVNSVVSRRIVCGLKLFVSQFNSIGFRIYSILREYLDSVQYILYYFIIQRCTIIFYLNL